VLIEDHCFVVRGIRLPHLATKLTVTHPEPDKARELEAFYGESCGSEVPEVQLQL
jgi:hypothetical protein